MTELMLITRRFGHFPPGRFSSIIFCHRFQFADVVAPVANDFVTRVGWLGAKLLPS